MFIEVKEKIVEGKGAAGKGTGNKCVGAARNVSPNWSLETMTCHSSHCFSVVWGQGNAPLVTFLLSSCYMTPQEKVVNITVKEEEKVGRVNLLDHHQVST